MQSVQRQFGRLWNKGPGDNAKVSILLNDYEDADKVLAKIIDSSRSWRESWLSLITTQLQVVAEYEGLYDPITGASDGHGRETDPTPKLQLDRTFRLKEAYAELKAEIFEEIAQIEDRIVKPATDARDCIQPIRKTIKKRENKRLDYEKCQDKVNKLHRKPSRTPKEDVALAKAEEEMANVSDEFSIADNHLRETLPPVVAASFSLIPPLLATHILIQNRLLGLYYTTLSNYCEEMGFPSPPPPMEDVIAEWNASFRPAQREVESISCIARGKATHQPMNIGDDAQSRKPSASSQPPTQGFRRSSSGLIPSAGNGPAQRPSISGPLTRKDSSPQPSPGLKRPDYLAPTDFTTATVLGQSPGVSPDSLRPRTEYFSGNRSSTTSTIASNASQLSLNNGLAKKKPPPPPPPAKRLPSTKPEQYVIAQYAFPGQGEGDLSFREGDRIKIIKKTNTDQDWWVGELAGVRGSFPANYCKAA